MVSIQELRKILSQDGQKFSDEELVELRNFFTILADIEIDNYEKTGKFIYEIAEEKNHNIY